jgi:hypothetical protein
MIAFATNTIKIISFNFLLTNFISDLTFTKTLNFGSDGN